MCARVFDAIDRQLIIPQLRREEAYINDERALRSHWHNLDFTEVAVGVVTVGEGTADDAITVSATRPGLGLRA